MKGQIKMVDEAKSYSKTANVFSIILVTCSQALSWNKIMTNIDQMPKNKTSLLYLKPPYNLQNQTLKEGIGY